MPTRAARICPRCKGRVTTSRCEPCEKKRQPARDTKTPDERRFYGSAEWKRIRARHLAKEPLCRTCFNAGRVTAGNTVDHIVPMREGGDPRDPDNLQTQCLPHHQRKRQEERTTTARRTAA